MDEEKNSHRAKSPFGIAEVNAAKPEQDWKRPKSLQGVIACLLFGGAGLALGATLWTPAAVAGGVILVGAAAFFWFRPAPRFFAPSSWSSAKRALTAGVLVGLLIGIPACSTALFVHTQQVEAEQAAALEQIEDAVSRDDPAAVERLWPLIAFAEDDDDDDHHRFVVVATYRERVRQYRDGQSFERSKDWNRAQSTYSDLGEFRDARKRAHYATGRQKAGSQQHLPAAVAFRKARGYRDAGRREKAARASEAVAIRRLIEDSSSQKAITRLNRANSNGGIPNAKNLRAAASDRIATAKRHLADAQTRVNVGDGSGALSILNSSAYVSEFPKKVSRIRSEAQDVIDSLPSYGGRSPSVDLPNIDIPFIPFM